MSKHTIEWTDATRNPVRSCTKIRQRCPRCCTENFAQRFRDVVIGTSFWDGFP